MELPQIRLESTYAKIEIKTKKDHLQIEQPPADLSIQQPKAEMQIDKVPSKLTIDQTKARADVDLKSVSRRTEEAAQKGRQDWLEGIARRIQEGEDLMKIENGGNPIVEQAKSKRYLPEHEFGIGWVPTEGSVQINYDPGKVDINWKVHKPIISSRMRQPIINYTPGNVEINMKQYQSLKIDFNNLKFVGTNYEQLI
ncbi:DUF6470 family protein [Neobacillus sp. PS3-40]|uniref:DUF6470 family protein n=1 Tax=Neobacillus sp. PS3-40 TaxID=3070679 RepID=UPI0027DFCF3A|nr:DUF6470 family protein [Neobacillus sp. PS3-40]WML46088.1 DUF6470 family protein [Neobacillus sp. PS3-40]